MLGVSRSWGEGGSQAPGEGEGLPRAGAADASLIGRRPQLLLLLLEGGGGDWTIHRNYFSKACTVSLSISAMGKGQLPGIQTLAEGWGGGGGGFHQRP